jgi:cytochrome c5
MSLRILVFCCALILAACANDPAPQPAADVEAAVPAETRISGEDAYLQYCAGCHETGLLDAPVVGNQSDWEHRSQLWQAVVMAHARNGYLDMPARGGRPDLPDPTIDAAVEYMLEITYVDLPPD